jgi:hypothetical protein
MEGTHRFKVSKKQNRILLGLAVAALVAIFIYQVGFAKAKLEYVNWIGGFNCFNESQCVNGWNNGTSYAVNDWNGGVYAHNLNGGNINCLNGESLLECHGYIHGYVYEWDKLWLQEHNMTSSPIIHSGLAE